MLCELCEEEVVVSVILEYTFNNKGSADKRPYVEDCRVGCGCGEAEECPYELSSGRLLTIDELPFDVNPAIAVVRRGASDAS